MTAKKICSAAAIASQTYCGHEQLCSHVVGSASHQGLMSFGQRIEGGQIIVLFLYFCNDLVNIHRFPLAILIY